MTPTKTNLSVVSLNGYKVDAKMQVGQIDGTFTPYDIFDANAVNQLIDSKIADLVDGAPSTADTLKELSDEIGTVSTALTQLSGTVEDLTNATPIYYSFEAYNSSVEEPTSEDIESTGKFKTTGGKVNNKIEIEVLSDSAQDPYTDMKFYVSPNIAVGDTLYPLYDIDDSAVGTSLKITAKLN